ncbi:MAG: prepilin-type N-terminal cleavage/methylation domain-containing protein, partial [Candidatus Omnitrophica bacterium]|nr:prepilin-type N-terminal cleavage/methylation domain-containing protein [Candidatus Omnitrophota bacterium]
MSNKRAFTLIEVLIGIMLFAIMSIAVASLFRLYGDLIKKPAEQSVNLPRYQAAVFHLIKNIRNSTWITIPDSNNIELHSHSNPDIRKYKFEGNKLKFKEGSANYRVLIENIGATEFFKGEGNEKPGNRFQKVKIEFWEKAIGNHTESDIFYNSLELASEESWDAIYIDPLNASTYKDGTKVFPFSILDDTLSNILQDEVIYVLSGEYDFYDETTLPCKGLDFFPGTILTVNPASHVKMGFDTVLLSEGEFYCS